MLRADSWSCFHFTKAIRFGSPTPLASDPIRRDGRTNVMHFVEAGARKTSTRNNFKRRPLSDCLQIQEDSRLDLPVMDVLDANSLIIRIAIDQDREAFARLFNYYVPRLKGFLMKRGETPEAAEDLAQETLVRMWRHAGSFDPTRADASAWLFAIARNLKIDTFRRDRRAELHTDDFLLRPEEPPQPEDVLLGNECRERVQRAMGTLPEEQLDLVRLSFFEGRSHGEIADLTGVPLGTVKSRLRLAFGRLRNNLDDLR
jgi:RNA polymerase sigma-70 factor (ECF subfamily)